MIDSLEEGRARLSVDFVDGTPSVRFHRMKLRASGLDLPGPFQPPLTVEVVSSPAVRGVGVDRVGTVLDCKSGARGLRCVTLGNGMTDVHTPEEHIAVADLEGMVDVTLALLDAARA